MPSHLTIVLYGITWTFFMAGLKSHSSWCLPPSSYYRLEPPHTAFIIFKSKHVKKYILLFLLPYYLAKNSSTIMNNSGEIIHPCLILDFRGNVFSLSPLRKMLSVGLYYIVFILLRYDPSILSFFRDFIMKGCWILSLYFSTSIEIIVIFVFFYLCAALNLFIWEMLKHACIPGMKPNRPWYMIFFMCCWIFSAGVLLRNFISVFMKKISV
jgi:hypothetical protein